MCSSKLIAEDSQSVDHIEDPWEDATDGMTTALHSTVMPVEVAMSDSQRQARGERERGRAELTAPAMMNSVRPLHSEGNEMAEWEGGRLHQLGDRNFP